MIITKESASTRGSLVFPLDLEEASKNHPVNFDDSGDYKPTDMPLRFIWVTWGRSHVREAVANACWTSVLNRRVFPNASCEVYVLEQELPLSQQSIESALRHGVTIIKDAAPRPTNRALFDTDRIGLISQLEGPCLYMDSDLYSFYPVKPKSLEHQLQTFGMGPARIGKDCAIIHDVIDEFFNAPSSIYFSDVGIKLEDFEGPDFWPWLRINLGLIYTSNGRSLKAFYEEFLSYNQLFAQTEYFGVGELVFTAMENAGLIPFHKFTWENGWNKVWPWIHGNTDKAIVEVQNDKIVYLAPSDKHHLVHMIHTGNGFLPHLRKFQSWIEEGEIYFSLRVSPVVRCSQQQSFEML